MYIYLWELSNVCVISVYVLRLVYWFLISMCGLEILLSIILVLFGYKWYKNYKINERLKWLPNVPGWPIIGIALEFGDSTDFLDNLGKLISKYGKLIKGDLLTQPNILATDYDFVQFVLGTSFVLNKSNYYQFLEKWIGTGLLTSGGLKWKVRRKMITPAFHFSILEHYIASFEPNEKILIEQLEKELDKDSVDIYPYINLYALDVICETAMGVSVNAQKYNKSNYVQSVKEVCRIAFDRAFSLLKRHYVTYILSRDYYKEVDVVSTIHAHTNSVIETRRKELENKTVNMEKEQDDFGRKKKMAFLDILLQSTIDGKPLSTEDIREEVDTFMFEGHDTTSSAMSFALYLLANHPDVQNCVLEEQKAIFGEDITRNASYNDLQAMKYLELVIKETLRLYPSVPVYGRVTNEDTEYKGNIIPKGTNITVFAYGVLRDPDNYSDPDKFKPERFAHYDGTRPFSFIPFSAGPRNCIGQKFGMLEVKSTLSTILRNFELLPSIPEHKLILLSEAVLKSKNGIRIRLKRREW